MLVAALGEVVVAELPVLVRVVDAGEQTLALLVLRQVQEELDDAGAVAVQVPLRIDDGTVAALPQRLALKGRVRQVLGCEDVGAHAHDQHLLVVGSVEDADTPALGQGTLGAPKEVVVKFLGAGVLEAEHLAALRIDAGHDVADGTVLTGRVHSLEDQQQGVAVVGIKQTLQLAEPARFGGQHLVVGFFR